MPTLKRLRKQAAYEFLASKGFDIVTHSRTKLELELLFQILINRYSKATNQEPEKVYAQIVSSLYYYKRNDLDKATCGRIGENQDTLGSVFVGSLLNGNEYDNPLSTTPGQSASQYEYRTNPIKPNDPTIGSSSNETGIDD